MDLICSPRVFNNDYSLAKTDQLAIVANRKFSLYHVLAPILMLDTKGLLSCKMTNNYFNVNASSKEAK